MLVVSSPELDPAGWAKSVAILRSVPTLRCVLVVAPAGAATIDVEALQREAGRPDVTVHDFHALLAREDGSRLDSQRQFAPEEPCAYFHTGGTTGYPKVAVHTHLNEAFLAWVLEAISEPDQILLCGLPLFHVNGAIVTGLSAFHCGSEVVILTAGGFRTPGVIDNFWSFANRFRATSFSAVPTIYAALAQRPLPAGGLHTLRRGVCGAAPLPRQVALAFEQATGIRIFEGYGLTEGTCVSACNPHQGEPDLGTVGIRLPFQPMKIFKVDAQGVSVGEAAAGESGVVGISGPNVFGGYLRDQDNRGIWLGEGWLSTGDLGRLDAHERLVLCGRAKDLIIRGGHNIDPAMIEDALARHPAVAMAAAVGEPDAHAGEIPVAYVQLKPSCSVDRTELEAYARQFVPERAAIPARIEVLPALPLTAVGKISKPHLRQRATQAAVDALLEKQGWEGVSTETALTAEKGIVVRVSCEAGQWDAVQAAIGRLNVHLEWKELTS